MNLELCCLRLEQHSIYGGVSGGDDLVPLCDYSIELVMSSDLDIKVVSIFFFFPILNDALNIILC